MRVIKAICFALISAASAFSQTGRIGSGWMNGPTFAVYFETRVEPSTPEIKGCCGHGHSGSGSDLDRVLTYTAERTYFGYNLRTELGPGDSYTLTFRPLRLTEARAKESRIDLSTWKQWSWTVPGPQTVHLGDVIVLDLLVNPGTGQKIVEYITLQEPHRPGFNDPTPREFSYVTGAPRDFRVEDAQLHIKSPLFSVNGKVDDSSTGSLQEVRGTAVWLYVPGRGRLVLSLTPRPGFQKVGDVRGTSLSFKVGSDTLSVSSAVRIAPGDAPFNLYAFHDPTWRPTYANANTSIFQIGVAERAEDLVGR